MSQSARGGEYAQFRKTFFEECAEILADMDARLTTLRADADREEVNAIFRAVHSIKAGAGVFGYAELVAFTHTFEALLDRLRAGRIVLCERVSLTIVRAGDVLAALVAAAQDDLPVEQGFGAEVLEDLLALLDEETAAPEAPPAKDTAAAPGAPAAGRFEIVFRPRSELFRHANEPLLLIRELQRLGRLEVACDASRLPTLAGMDPEEAYLAWTFRLETDRTRADVLEVFEFVDEDCELSVEAIGGVEPAAAGAPRPETTAVAPPAAADPRPQAGAGQAPARGSGVSSIRVDLARIDRLVNVVGELVITQAMLVQEIADSAASGVQIRGQEDLGALTRELQECVMAIRMQPVKSVFARMPRLVRDLAGKLGKKVRLVTAGEQTEVDKTVVEELADPLTHMIRNAIDHGIEDVATRVSAGKPEEGLIELSAAHVGSNILIHLTDDGAGIDRERLLAKAQEKGIVPAGVALTDEEIDDLIFAPGFSTAREVTDVSGRGVGMDVVRRNIVNLGGRIQVQSTAGRGTRFTLVIPLTLAVLDGMLVAVGGERYILPLTSIVESFRPERAQVRRLANGSEVVAMRGDYVRIVHLDAVFGVEGAVTEPWKGLVVIVETAGGGRIGLAVDELIGQQQVVIKSLSENFDPVDGISGATILGNGRVALILDIERLPTLAERPRRTTPPDGLDHDRTSPILLDAAE